MRRFFRSMAAAGLNEDQLPVRLFHLAKKWFWDPAAINFAQDAVDWQRLSDTERDVILRLTSLFQAGEEAVTLDLLPLLQVIAQEGRLEEEMYLTSFLFEEAKHVEFFQRFLRAVGVSEDLHRYHSHHYKAIFYEELPRSMNRLAVDASPSAQAEAAVTYNIVVEGLLAETGYHAYASMLGKSGLFPGLLKGIQNIKRDESRHIAWGLYHCSRLIADDPSILSVINKRAETLLEHALGVITDLFSAYPDTAPFGLTPEMFLEYAMEQYQRRMSVLDRTEGVDTEAIMRVQALDENESGGSA